jgi:aspartate/methionine/tyrosine aminotransferase
VLEPCDEVLIEHPAYGPILDVARYLEANVKRFSRVEENGWAVDPADIRRSVTPKTRLIAMTNLHNPTSVLTSDSVLREVGDIARSIGALVLVDEVYLDAVYEETPRTSFHLGPEFVVTSSLTKVYGVSGLRCGWILARPDLAWKMRRLNDLYAAAAVYPGELLSVAVFKHLPLLRERARQILDLDRELLRDFLAQQSAVSAVWTDWGTTSFVRLRSGKVDSFLEGLRAASRQCATACRSVFATASGLVELASVTASASRSSSQGVSWPAEGGDANAGWCNACRRDCRRRDKINKPLPRPLFPSEKCRR